MITDYAASLLMATISTLEDEVARLRQQLNSFEQRYEEKLTKQQNFFMGQLQQERAEKRTLLDRFVPEIQSAEYRNYEAGKSESVSQNDWKQRRFSSPTDRIKLAMEAEQKVWDEKLAELREGAQKVVEAQKLHNEEDAA